MNSLGRLDASAFGSSRGGHFRLHEPYGPDFAWTLIRKNGSSSMVNFLESRVPEAKEPKIRRLANISRFFGVDSQEAANAPSRVLILRDPMERLQSLFINKFIHAHAVGRQISDIAKEAQKLTGQDWTEIGWEEFCLAYVLHPEASDPHLRRQSDHCGPIDYNAVAMIDSMPELMNRVVGKTLSGQWFRERTNSSPMSYRMQIRSSRHLRANLENFYSSDYELLGLVEWR
jgi:hypothetical protein